MDPGPPRGERARLAPSLFATTHWSLVLTAGDSSSSQAATALDQFCRIYWYPVYVYVRGTGADPEEARDLTQEFFARLIEKDVLASVHRERGPFRWFLLCAVKRFLLNERDRAAALKRGGTVRHVPFDGEKAEQRYRLDAAHWDSPDKLFDRAWAADLVTAVYRQLQEEYTLEGKAALFKRLRALLSGDRLEVTYAELGMALGMTEGAVKVAVHRARRRYRDLLRERVAGTLHSPADVEEELRGLQAAFSPGV